LGVRTVLGAYIARRAPFWRVGLARFVVDSLSFAFSYLQRLERRIECCRILFRRDTVLRDATQNVNFHRGVAVTSSVLRTGHRVNFFVAGARTRVRGRIIHMHLSVDSHIFVDVCPHLSPSTFCVVLRRCHTILIQRACLPTTARRSLGVTPSLFTYVMTVALRQYRCAAVRTSSISIPCVGCVVVDHLRAHALREKA